MHGLKPWEENIQKNVVLHDNSSFQTEQMSLWISDVSSYAWFHSAAIWSLTGDLYFLNFAIAISTSKVLGSEVLFMST
jgi:hypothetical protein